MWLLASSAARDAQVVFFLDRGWWGWNGWPAIAAIAAILAAVATAGTLIFFAIQMAMLRSQARRDATQRSEDLSQADGRRRADFRLEHTTRSS